MLNLQLRDEFKGGRLKGTTIDFSADETTGALNKPAAEFLGITYPSVDMLKVLEEAQPGKGHPIVLLGGRGLGKSHLMAALFHAMKDAPAATAWLADWSINLQRPEIAAFKFRTNCLVIAESLQRQRYKALWDILFDQHPHGNYIKGKWEGMGAKKPDVPSDLLLLEMFKAQPTALLLDEFQTWYDGLRNTPQYPWRNWAFNFIQLLSEIANDHPELLSLVVSIRDNQSEACQQIHRINPVVVDFQGKQAKKDRQRLLLYRVFQNRTNVPPAEIESLIKAHVTEHLRLAEIAPAQHNTRVTDFVEAWPYSPVLMGLLEDQVLVATQAQETRDLIRILVDLFKTRGEQSPVITAADFDITAEKGCIASLLSSVANPLHRTLLQKAQRNLEAVQTAVKEPVKNVPHAAEIISALWLRSLSVEKINGGVPAELQVDITRALPVDDNAFAAEMALIRENSFNIHPVGNRLVFKEEENAEGKLLANAKNDRLFDKSGEHDGQDIEQLAAEIRYVLAGTEEISRQFRVVVLRKNWRSDPWNDLPERDRPDQWGNQLVLIALPEYPENVEAILGAWLKQHMAQRRNTLRFLLPRKTEVNIYFDPDLIICARAVYLAGQWKQTDEAYKPLFQTYQNSHLRPKLRDKFDVFALLDIWNFAQPGQCKFIIEKHSATGDKIPKAVQTKIENEIFAPEDFEAMAVAQAKSSASLAKFIGELQEPAIGGNHCIPWLGEVTAKERVLKLCAAGKLAINVRGLELLQAAPGETEEACWIRIKGKLGSGKELEQTILQPPGAVPQSGGTLPLPLGPITAPPVTPAPGTAPGTPPSIFGGGNTPPTGPHFKPLATPPKTPVNLLGEVEKWGITPATNLSNINVNVANMTGAQLSHLLKSLPDGISYALNLDKEAQ
ncbi:MAG TPA: DUF499 domain-containing protein [Verrucomicrobiae bacterium]